MTAHAMQERALRVLSTLAGDDRRASLEQRLFNTMSLLNGVANLAGALFMTDRFLSLLHVLTGVAFLSFYYLARVKNYFRGLYWPFVLMTLGFIFLNALANAGTRGGAHYYLIVVVLIAIILSANARTTLAAICACVAVSATLAGLEEWRPDWIQAHTDVRSRLIDVASNLLFVEIFAGVVILVLMRNLNLERAKSERLLMNVLPQSIAQELKHHDQVMPREHPCASVLFTDFVGFTRIAERLTPQELIAKLDQCFRQFDRVAKKYDLEKIKTIGDSYMAVGGIPQANPTHAVDCVLAALAMKRIMQAPADHPEAIAPWQLRIGIHSGSLVAGVIGQEKFAYDVWGDTVNTASRLESSGAANQVNISRATYELVQDFFDCEYRGQVAAKGKGAIEMYFVSGLKPELSLENAGAEPNEEFYKRYAQLVQSMKGVWLRTNTQQNSAAAVQRLARTSS